MLKSRATDRDLIKDIVRAAVSESVFAFQLQFDDQIEDVRRQVAELQGRLACLEAPTAAPPTEDSTAELKRRLACLEAAATNTAKGIGELMVSGSPRAGPGQAVRAQQAVTYSNFRKLEDKVLALASEVTLLARGAEGRGMPSGEAIMKKFGDVEGERTSLREAYGAVHKQVVSLEEKREVDRITLAVFALNAISMRESERNICLRRLKDQEERLQQGGARDHADADKANGSTLEQRSGRRSGTRFGTWWSSAISGRPWGQTA
jgi:hypothetical protein